MNTPENVDRQLREAIAKARTDGYRIVGGMLGSRSVMACCAIGSVVMDNISYSLGSRRYGVASARLGVPEESIRLIASGFDDSMFCRESIIADAYYQLGYRLGVDVKAGRL